MRTGVVAGQRENLTALRGVALRLDYMIGQITPGEFHWQDANYDRDSMLGRELLYLIANSDWMRATSEEINIVRSDAIDTIIRIDVDLDRITNQVFADRVGQLWLPVLVLPPLLKPQPKRPTLPEPLSEPDPFSTLTVTDANGTPLVTLPNAEIRHRLAAALAEIIISIAGARRPGAVTAGAGASTTGFSPTRDHRLLLAAAIYRLLRGEHVPSAVLSGQVVARKPAQGQLARIDRARNEVGGLLAFYADHLDGPGPHGGPDSATARDLARRAAQVLRALAESTVVVVAVDGKAGRTVMTVAAPSRALHFAPARWARVLGSATESSQRWARPIGWRWLRPGNWVLPRASLEIDLLLPSADADRQIQVRLPDGVSPDPSVPVGARADLDIRTEQPVQHYQLAELTGQLISVRQTWPATLCQSLADLCVAKAEAAWATLRDHRVGAAPGELAISPQDSTQATRAFRTHLDQLGDALKQISDGNQSPDAWKKLGQLWGTAGWRNVPMQRRTLSDMISPDAVTARARVIEDASKRAAPAEARMQVHVAVTDSEYVSTATLAGWMNTLLMAVVFGFFASARFIGLGGKAFSPSVLAFVLTLFAAIQVGRIERHDRSTLRGLLLPAGNPLIVVSILPPVVLASALAFMSSRTHALIWAGASIGAQIALLSVQRFLLWRAFARGRRRGATASIAPKTGLVFYTDTPYYQHYEVLHSRWWRSTTGEALMIGRPAYGYVVWQHGNRQTLRSLLTGGRPAHETQLPAPRSQASRLPDWITARLPQAQSAAGRSPGGASQPTHNGGRSGQHDRDDDLGISALEQPASILGLLRIGTGSQSINFAVFRDEPKADWDCLPEDVVKVNFDPGRLGASDGSAGIVRVFLGFQPRLGLLPTGEHPVIAVLESAARHRLSVVEIQIPVPPPTTVYADLQWARVRLGFTEGTIGRLMPMLADLQELARKADSERAAGSSKPKPLVVGVQTVNEGVPRILNPRPITAGPGPGAGSNGRPAQRLVLASDLDVVSIGNVNRYESPQAKTWRMAALCADWRPGIELEILNNLDPRLCVVGLSAMTLHGKAVVLLIGQQPSGPATPSLRPPAGPGRSGIEAYLDKPQSRNELGTVQRHPVLRVRMRTPDRPGATLEILQSLRDSLQDIAPGKLGMHDWSVWYARAVVAEGNTARVELTVRLSVDPDNDLISGKPVSQWGPAEYTKIERQALALAASKMAAARQAAVYPEPGADTPEDTVIRVSLATIPDLA